MIIKTLEVRDRATFIPVAAVQLVPDNEGQRYLIRRAGYGPGQDAIVLFRLDGTGPAHYDMYQWPENPRTMRAAHMHIAAMFDTLEDGEVIDVEYLEGETPEKKKSERETV